MKNVLTLVFGILVFTSCYAQSNFVWKKTGAVAKTKSQIYSDTKMYIAKTWASSNDVMKDDDREGGVILYRAVTIVKLPYKLGKYEYVYAYNLTFRIKDHSYEIILDNVYCQSARLDGRKGSPVTKINPFEGDNCPETGTPKKIGLPKEEAIAMMSSFKKQLQDYVDGYMKYLKTSDFSRDK
jgi:hypothetical protein